MHLSARPLLPLAGLIAAALLASPAQAAPTGIPSKATAQTYLNSLTVAAEANAGTYDRDLFPHWITISGACNTRETVLKRDGTNVATDSSCAATSGSWYSPYDGATWTAASDLDIDHMVPLGQAWISGAKSWTRERREQFANDLVRPQLRAVTDNLNVQKSDKAPDAWKPPLVSYWCAYATDWIVVKHYYGLTITQAEKTALTDMLRRC